jgi:amino acid adenylation domain-containing protein
MRGLLQDWVTRKAEHRPEALALVGPEGNLTYGQLEQASNQLARLLHASGCQRGDRVGLLMPKSLAAVISILGILKADGWYVPIDAGSPAARVRKILEAADSRWLLAAGPVTALLDELLAADPFRTTLAVGWMGKEPPTGATFHPAFSPQDLASYSGAPVAARNSSQDPAHILFTSGSTGIPKGVMVTHANVIHFVQWAVTYFGLNCADRLSGHSPLHFDLSTFDLYGTFAAGAQLHLVPPELNLLPNKLAEFIRARQLTQWFSVPAVLNYMAKFDVVQVNDFPTLKRLLWCGEVLPTPALIYWMKRLPHVTFTNLYGPTETTIASSYYTVPECPDHDRVAIPIGTGCAGEELLVLDATLQPLPRGVIGDLYIRGVGLTAGYWRDAEKTRAAFIPNPHSADRSERLYRTGDLAWIGEDGLVYFAGRADTQIKSRGYRIELGEVEAAVQALNCLEESAVVAIQSGGFEGATICCAYVCRPSAEMKPAALRQQLTQLLPHYMLPARFMALDQLPKNANGKIDRPKLRQAFERGEVPRS